MKSTLKPTLLLMCGRSAAFAVTFLIPVVLVRTFDQAAFGTYKQLFLIYGTLFSIAQFGMAESLYYFLPNNPKAAGRFGANSTVILALLSWHVLERPFLLLKRHFEPKDAATPTLLVASAWKGTPSL